MSAPTHQLIKDTAALKQKKFRDESGTILVEGRHPIEEAVKAGLNLRHLFLLNGHEGGWPQIAYSAELYTIDENTMNRMASTSSAPPALAIFEAPQPAGNLQGDFLLVLDGIQDPGNLGTLARSALAFGIEGLVLTGESVEPFSPKVIRASAGLIFALPVLEIEREQLSERFQDGWKIYTTTGQPQARSYREAEYGGKTLIVLGNEGRGISEDLFAGRTLEPLTIPMAEQVESLNVAISGSIILAEAAARRREQA